MAVDKRHYKSEDYEYLRHEACPSCGSSNNVGVWLHKPTGKETKWCFTTGCTNNITTAALFSTEQPGTPLPQSWLDDLRISANTAQKYRMTREGKALYFGFATPEGILKRVKKRDYSVPKDSDYHFSWLTKEGECTLFFGMDTCTNPNKKLIITAGELDAPCVHEMTSGENCVSSPNGDKGLANCIRDNFLWLKQFKVIYLALDNDASGQAAMIQAQELLGYRARPVRLPDYRIPLEDGVVVLKDGRDYRKYSFDTEFLEALVAADNSVQPYAWSRSSLRDRVATAYQEGTSRHYSTGIPDLDLLCPIRLKEVTLVFGSPGRGKSSFGRFLAKELISQGIRTYYMSFEEPPENVVYKLSPLLLGEPIYYNNEGKVTNTLPDILDKTDRIADVLDIANIPTTDPDEIFDAIECAYVTYGCQFILLDHITWLLDSAPNPVAAARVIMHKLCQLVIKYPIHIFAVSHNQPGAKPAPRQGQILRKDWEEWEEPTQRDAQWSSGFEQMSYNIWGLKNPDDPREPMRIYVLKNRFGGKKKCGKVLAYFQDDGSFLGVQDAAKNARSQGSNRGRGYQDTIRFDSGEELDSQVLSSDTEVPTDLYSVPKPEGSFGEHSGTSGNQCGYEEESSTSDDDTGSGGTSEEVLTEGVQPRLHNSKRSNNRNKRGNARHVPIPGGDIQEPASSVLQEVPDRVPESKPARTKKKNLLPRVGRHDGNTLVPPATTWEEYVANTAEGLVNDDTPIIIE